MPTKHKFGRVGKTRRVFFPTAKEVETQAKSLGLDTSNEDTPASSPALTAWYVDQFNKLNHYK